MLYKTKIKHYIILPIMFFSCVNFAHASLLITEIMYSPENGSDNEWVEIYNNGSESIDLSKYRFFHGETNSGPITLKIGGSTILQPSKYAIIAKSLADYSWLDFSDMVFSSSVLSLPDSGDNTFIAISDSNKSLIDSIVYDVSLGGSKASKSSLSKIDGTWQSGIPTPGKINQKLISSETNDVSTPVTTSTIDSNNTTSSDLGSSSVKNEPDILKITTKIISPKIVTAGIPFSFSSFTTTNRGETYAVGRLIWNFGDGMVVEANESGPYEYTYEYPGDYSMTLSYFDSFFSKQPSASNKISIKVVSSEIFISSIGDDLDPFIELENKSNYEMTISNWIITAGTHYFTIPNGLNILPGKKIKLSPKITGFKGEDIKSVYISNINGEIVSVFPALIKKPIQKNIATTQGGNNKAVPNIKLNNSLPSENSNVINLNNLSASASGSGFEISNRVYSFLGLFVIIGIGITTFLIFKKRENIQDYVEREIRPEDMTIIE